MTYRFFGHVIYTLDRYDTQKGIDQIFISESISAFAKMRFATKFCLYLFFFCVQGVPKLISPIRGKTKNVSAKPALPPYDTFDKKWG